MNELLLSVGSKQSSLSSKSAFVRNAPCDLSAKQRTWSWGNQSELVKKIEELIVQASERGEQIVTCNSY